MKLRSKTGLAALVIGAAMLLLLATLAAPGQPAEEETVTVPQTTLRLVYAYQNRAWSASVQEVVRQFEAEYPDIRVEYEIRYEDGVYEDVLGKLAARDELGDIVQLKEPYSWAESGLIAPLPEQLSRLVTVGCSVDGQTWAVGALGTTTGMIYNKTLFEQYGLSEPTTYEEFLSLCKALRRRGVSPLGVGAKDLWHLEYWLNHFLRADVLTQEPDFLALCAAGERDWNDSLVKEMLAHLAGLFQAGYVNEGWLTTPDGALAYEMAEGEVAMVFSGPWLAQEVQALDDSVELGWFYVANEAGETVAGDSEDVFWAVTAGCARDEARYAAAVTFLEFFYSPDVYEQVCTSMSGYSLLADETRSGNVSDGIIGEITAARQRADVHLTAYVGNEDTPAGFEKRLLGLLTRLCSGEITVEQCQQQTQEYWQLCLEQEAAYE